MCLCVCIHSPAYRDGDWKSIIQVIIQNINNDVCMVSAEKTFLQKYVSKAFSLLIAFPPPPPPPHAYGLKLRSRKFSQKNIFFWESLLPSARELSVKCSTCLTIRRHWVSCTSVWCWGYACRHMRTWFPWAEGVALLLQLKLLIGFFCCLKSVSKKHNMESAFLTRFV